MDYYILKSFTNYIDAHILMGRLEEEGIRCWLQDENTITIDPILTNALGGIKLMVPKEQAERALDLLNRFTEERKSKRSCPKCGSHEIEQVSTPRKASNWISAIVTWITGSYAIAPDQVWHCFSCGAEFSEPVEQPSNIS